MSYTNTFNDVVRKPASVLLADITGFTEFTTALFNKSRSNIPLHDAMLHEYSSFRNNIIHILNSYDNTYPANRMGDGFLFLIYGLNKANNRSLIKIAYELRCEFNSYHEKIKSLDYELGAKLKGIKCSGVTHAEINEIIVDESTRNNRTFDPKDFISIYINLAARMHKLYDTLPERENYCFIMPRKDYLSIDGKKEFKVTDISVDQKLVDLCFKGFTLDDLNILGIETFMAIEVLDDSIIKKAANC